MRASICLRKHVTMAKSGGSWGLGTFINIIDVERVCLEGVEDCVGVDSTSSPLFYLYFFGCCCWTVSIYFKFRVFYTKGSLKVGKHNS